MTLSLEKQIEEKFGIPGAVCAKLDVPVNEVFMVTAPAGKFALKRYHKMRTLEDVTWETDLLRHLAAHGAPVIAPIKGTNGYVEEIILDGKPSPATLSTWAPGVKPDPEQSTYILLGQAAAQIHLAADFRTSIRRTKYDADVLIDEQLERMKRHLEEADRWDAVEAMGRRLRKAVASRTLDWGICHMDLTLDNVHREGDTLTVYDFDSAGESWRAIEPHGVLKESPARFVSWLEGYRAVRSFDYENERAVRAFVVIGDLRMVAWKLGVANSSRGKPLLKSSDLTGVVDEWLKLEQG